MRKNHWPRVVGYDDAGDLNPGALHWLDVTANVRIHGTTGERPVDRLPLEQLRPIAGVPPYRALVLERRRVDRDSYVSYASNWYSVPAEHASREVWVRQTDDRVIVSFGDQVIADHPLHLGRRQRITDAEHFTRLAERRDVRLEREVADALSRVLLPAGIEGPEVEKRPLSIYEELV